MTARPDPAERVDLEVHTLDDGTHLVVVFDHDGEAFDKFTYAEVVALRALNENLKEHLTAALDREAVLRSNLETRNCWRLAQKRAVEVVALRAERDEAEGKYVAEIVRHTRTERRVAELEAALRDAGEALRAAHDSERWGDFLAAQVDDLLARIDALAGDGGGA